eukprot:GHVS01045108.1.p1 GENE.GHVS01045108.1~~GHVS01045108.1.p1  ORF type:complete len:549 (+),score=62.85 GHVS01045108.1:197-1648(+)
MAATLATTMNATLATTMMATETVSDSQVTPGAGQDLDPRWFNNPQFNLNLQSGGRTCVFISLIQSEKHMHTPINFLVIKNSGTSRLWECNEADVIASANDDSSSKAVKREVTRVVTLDPSIHGTSFVISCYQDTFKPDTTVAQPFYLRIFASEKVSLEAIRPPFCLTFKGEWRNGTAGGRRSRKTLSAGWCMNPQLILNFNRPTTVKIVCERPLPKRRRETSNVGFTLARLHSGVDVGRRQSKQVVKPVKSFAKQLPTKAIAPALGTVRRKLQVLQDEWSKETSFASEDIACMYFSVLPLQGPLVVVPSTSEPGVFCGFTIRVFSDRPLKDAVMLDETKNVAVTGSWNANSAGGCHLFHAPYTVQPKAQTWKNNPKFVLTVFQAFTGHLTLARLDRQWMRHMAQDGVGCMMGVYVMKGFDGSFESIAAESGFLPGNEVTLEMKFEASGTPYVIMPTTFQPNKCGEFVLSLGAPTSAFSLAALS